MYMFECVWPFCGRGRVRGVRNFPYFRKIVFGVLYSLVTPVLRFALLPYYQRYLYEYHLHQLTSSSSNENWKLRSSLSPKNVQINQWHEKKVMPGYSIIHIRNVFFTSLISETPCKASRICIKQISFICGVNIFLYVTQAK